MDFKAIKQALPHVDRLWLKGEEWFIHSVPDAVEVDLNEMIENSTTIPTQEAPVKPSKKK